MKGYVTRLTQQSIDTFNERCVDVQRGYSEKRPREEKGRGVGTKVFHVILWRENIYGTADDRNRDGARGNVVSVSRANDSFLGDTV